ncbi:MAG: elongation factor 1-beta [Candidatus Altiarchaeota archaeon]
MPEWNVVAKLRLMPTEVGVDFDSITESVRKLSGGKCLVHSIEKKPIAFGLNALEVNLLFNDKEGGMEEIQEKIRRIEGVSEVEVTDLNRL